MLPLPLLLHIEESIVILLQEWVGLKNIQAEVLGLEDLLEFQHECCTLRQSFEFAEQLRLATHLYHGCNSNEPRRGLT